MERRKIFRRILTVLLIGFLALVTSIVHAEIKTYEGIGDYPLSEDNPPKEIKSKAKLYAERDALEKAGVFISTYSKTKNFELVKDEIISITGTILKIIDTTYELIPINDEAGIGKYRATVIAEIDTNNIDAAFEKWLGRDKKERSVLAKQNEELQRTVDEQNKKIAALEEIISNAKTDADKKEIHEKIKAIDKETLYAQKLDEAKKLIEDKKYEDAVKIYTEAIEIDPNSAEAYYHRCYAYDWLSQCDKSLQDINKALELNPNYADAYYLRGWIYYSKKNYDAMIKDFDKAIELEPNNFIFYESRGKVYYFFVRNYDAAIKDLSKAIELNPKADGSYYIRASVYLDLENYDEAVYDYVKAIELDPTLETDYTGLSLAIGGAKSDKSIESLTKFIKIKPNEAEGYFYRGYVYYNQKKYDAAIKDYSKAIEIDKKNPWIYKSRADIYFEMKNYDAAIKDYSKAIEVDPKDSSAYLNRGVAYFCLKNYDQSIKDYTKAIELYPEYGLAYNNRGNAYLKIGNKTKAQADFTKAKELGYNG